MANSPAAWAAGSAGAPFAETFMQPASSDMSRREALNGTQR